MWTLVRADLWQLVFDLVLEAASCVKVLFCAEALNDHQRSIWVGWCILVSPVTSSFANNSSESSNSCHVSAFAWFYFLLSSPLSCWKGSFVLMEVNPVTFWVPCYNVLAQLHTCIVTLVFFAEGTSHLKLSNKDWKCSAGTSICNMIQTSVWWMTKMTAEIFQK